MIQLNDSCQELLQEIRIPVGQEKARHDLFLACDQLGRAVLQLSRLEDANPFEIVEGVEAAVNSAVSEFDPKRFIDLRPIEADQELPQDFSGLYEEIKVDTAIVLNCARLAGVTSQGVLQILDGQIREVLEPELKARVAA